MEKTWSELVNFLYSHAQEEERQTVAFAQRRQLEKDLNETMFNSIAASDRKIVEDILFQLFLFQEQDAAVAYRRGMLDCVELLKHLGVLC